MEELFIRRCAELTLKDSYDWFSFYVKERKDNYSYSAGVQIPEHYGIIHMKKGSPDRDGFDAKAIMHKRLPADIQN